MGRGCLVLWGQLSATQMGLTGEMPQPPRFQGYSAEAGSTCFSEGPHRNWMPFPLTTTCFGDFSLPWLTSPTSLIVPSGSLLQTTYTQVLLWGKPPPLSISEGMAARPLSLICSHPDTPSLWSISPSSLASDTSMVGGGFLEPSSETESGGGSYMSSLL